MFLFISCKNTFHFWHFWAHCKHICYFSAISLKFFVLTFLSPICPQYLLAVMVHIILSTMPLWNDNVTGTSKQIQIAHARWIGVRLYEGCEMKMKENGSISWAVAAKKMWIYGRVSIFQLSDQPWQTCYFLRWLSKAENIDTNIVLE